MKYILSILFVFVSLLASAQFQKGDKFIGGTFSINNASGSGGTNGGPDTRNIFFGLYPTLGFFLNDKFAIGGSIGYSMSYQKSMYDGSTAQKSTSHSFLIGGFVKRYFMISEKFFFAVEGGLNYSRGTQKNDNGSTENKTKNYSIGLSARPSLIFFPSPRWGIEGSIGGLSFDHSRDLSFDSKYSGFNFNYGTFSVGFAYYLRRPAG